MCFYPPNSCSDRLKIEEYLVHNYEAEDTSLCSFLSSMLVDQYIDCILMHVSLLPSYHSSSSVWEMNHLKMPFPLLARYTEIEGGDSWYLILTYVFLSVVDYTIKFTASYIVSVNFPLFQLLRMCLHSLENMGSLLWQNQWFLKNVEAK